MHQTNFPVFSHLQLFTAHVLYCTASAAKKSFVTARIVHCSSEKEAFLPASSSAGAQFFSLCISRAVDVLLHMQYQDGHDD